MSTLEKVGMPNKMESSFELTRKNQPLHGSVRQAVENYIAQLNGQMPTNLYDMVISIVEEPLMQCVMEYTKNNQSRAAIVLGLSRGTLRKLLKKYGMLT